LLRAQFYHTPHEITLNGLNPGEELSFIITITNLAYHEEGNDFTLELFDDPDGIYDWISISPSSFTLYYESNTQNVTVSGTIPVDWVERHHQSGVNISDNSTSAYTLFDWMVYNSSGEEDFIIITEYDTEFYENDELYYKAQFIDNTPGFDLILDWDLTITLYTSEGD
jgi:hypothetical protein